ncbi:MAG TPA: hypothetical protein VI547_09115 [Anaerolineales bacterium]|nr:hypothetical protein [Anaerolineales bacterium]
MICPLCGFKYDETNLICHAACPLAKDCAILCCPNCGYQIVDESKSGLAKLLRRVWKPAPLRREPPPAKEEFA